MKLEIDLGTEIIAVDGVQISLEVLKDLANPRPNTAYTMERKSDEVWVTRHVMPVGQA